MVERVLRWTVRTRFLVCSLFSALPLIQGRRPQPHYPGLKEDYRTGTTTMEIKGIGLYIPWSGVKVW